jgi:osmotically-inducible protein OsmY
LPSHPYGPPGSGHLVDGSKNNNGNYPDDDKAETPYEKSDPQKGFTAVVNKPSISEDKTTIDSEVNGTQATERDRHKTENDRLLNRKIRHEINGGFEDSFPGVVLVTSDGLVVIEGTVPNIESHDKLERSISKIEGVKSVTNNTTVKAQR